MNDDSHTRAHGTNAFCGNAGPEEMKHFQRLLDVLDDAEIVTLADAIGIRFQRSTQEVDRDTLEGALDEANHEDFTANITVSWMGVQTNLKSFAVSISLI